MSVFFKLRGVLANSNLLMARVDDLLVVDVLTVAAIPTISRVFPVGGAFPSLF